MNLQMTAVPDDPGLILLPWDIPLEDWPEEHLVALPRGISRHIVRFTRLDGRVYAVKEVGQRLAQHEYETLRRLEKRHVPSVEAVGVVTGRATPEGEPLETALITRHLQFSLPYRALFSQTLRPDTANRLLDALALLLVRLHLAGFYWGDCSLSNTLFRRDAGAFAAYLVDAETGELHDRLSDGQRQHDLDVAGMNIAGELMDLEAGDMLDPNLDPGFTALDIVARYERLWVELTSTSVFGFDERYKLEQRLRRLNELGFDVDEVQMSTESGGRRIVVTPKVVDAGHHSRRLLRLTGLDVQENQARRLLNDIDTYRAALGAPSEDEEIVAHKWLDERFEPTVREVPKDLWGKLEPAEVYHEVLEHQWYLSEAAGFDVGLDVAVLSYVDNVLKHRPDEKAMLGKRIGIPSGLVP